MSDLAATNCTCGCEDNCGGLTNLLNGLDCNCILLILLLMYCCGGSKTDCGCNNTNNHCWLFLIMMLCCGGNSIV